MTQLGDAKLPDWHRHEADFRLDSDFMAWIEQLELVIRAWDEKYGNCPYEPPLSETTGLECWHYSYIDGYTPQEAFDIDQQHWDN